jgi:pimeloyl-ACP methyl ester carboxylesterase
MGETAWTQTRQIPLAGRTIETAEIAEIAEIADFAGAVGRRPIVLMHEGLGSIGLWRDFPAALAGATGRRVVAFSRPGHGRSQPPIHPPGLGFFDEEALERLPVVLEALDVRAPVLVGHSDGGSIALIHAAHHEVTALVLMAAHVFVEDESIAAIREARERFRAGDLRERLARHHAHPDAAFHGWCDRWLDPDFRDWSIEAQADRVRCPALLIQGTADPYGTVAQLDTLVAHLAGPCERLEPATGHSPHLEAPEEVVGAIARFCSSLP